MTEPVERDGAITMVFNFDDGAELWTATGLTAADVNGLQVPHAYDLVSSTGVLRHSNRRS